MFKYAAIIFCGAIFLAGCTTGNVTHNPSEETTPSTTPAPLKSASALNWVDTNAVHHPYAYYPRNFRPPTSTNPSPATQTVPAATWISLNRWAAGHGLGNAHKISETPVVSYAISSKKGTMVLNVGSDEATWNNVEIHLGFDPQIIDGEICLRRLDLEKNLEPLLCDPPLTFGHNRVIVIDPGHGGKNTGTHSVLDGRFEKEFTLDWAKQLKPLLEREGWTVFLTRTSDIDLSLSNRVAFAEMHHADLFISLHFNSAGPDAKEAGLETYCMTPTGMPSTITRGYADILSEHLPNNAFDAQNLQLAVRLQTAILRTSGETDRGVRRARFIAVLRGQNRPAVLIEGGYLSNPREAKLIETAAFREKLAKGIAAALQ